MTKHYIGVGGQFWLDYPKPGDKLYELTAEGFKEIQKEESL